MNSRQEEFLLQTLHNIDKSLKRMLGLLQPVDLASSFEFYQINNGQKEKVTSMFMKVDEKVELALAIKDRRGNEAKVDGVPVWSLTDEALGKLEVKEDGMSAVFFPAAVGVLKVQVKADADLGEGVKDIIGELDVEISALEAEKIEISAVVSPQ